MALTNSDNDQVQLLVIIDSKTTFNFFFLSVCLSHPLSVLTASFPGGPGLAGTRTSPFWILLELRMMEMVSGDNWSYKTYKAPAKLSPPTNQINTHFFYRPDTLPVAQLKGRSLTKLKLKILCRITIYA